MTFWKILTVICAVSVYAESKWSHRHKREIHSSICDPVHNSTDFVQCYCARLTHHPDQITTAECYSTAKNVSQNHPSWDRFRLLQNISRLTLTNTRGVALDYIPTNALKYTKAILRLDVKYCNIDKLESYAFANLSLIEEMTLRDNQIRTMAVNAFAHHARLKTISLDQNNIAEIYRNVFIDLPSLEQLFLTANKITTIHDRAFVHLTNLKELEIDKNSLFSLNSETFSGLNNLEKLELSGNSLEVVGDNTFAPLINLRFLNLGSNKIQMLDEKAFNGLARLQVLTLEHNKLSTLENEKFFDSLESLTSLSLKDNEISVIKPEVMLPILSNFYGKTSQLNIEGNNLVCDCKLDVFRPLLNKTQNSRLGVDIQNLQCHPNDEVKQIWDRIQETAKNTGQVFEDVEPQEENTAYEYYDETELNGTIFYFDMRYILNCSSDERSPTPDVPATSITQQFNKPAPRIEPINNLNAKVTSSPLINIVSTTVKPRKHLPIKIDNNNLLDLSLDEATEEDANEKSRQDNSNTVNIDEPTRHKPSHRGNHEARSDKKDTVYTTSRLATVSAKPLESKHYEDQDMASDEAKPDRLKAHRSIHEEEKEASNLNINNASKDDGCMPLLISIIFSLLIFL